MQEQTMTVKTYRTGQEALDELERELNIRARCFPRWISEGKVSRTDAQDRLDRLATAHCFIESLMVADMHAAVADVWASVEAKQKQQVKS